MRWSRKAHAAAVSVLYQCSLFLVLLPSHPPNSELTMLSAAVAPDVMTTSYSRGGALSSSRVRRRRASSASAEGEPGSGELGRGGCDRGEGKEEESKEVVEGEGDSGLEEWDVR